SFHKSCIEIKYSKFYLFGRGRRAGWGSGCGSGAARMQGSGTGDRGAGADSAPGRLFRPETVDRVGAGGADSLETDGNQGDGEGRQGGQDKDCGADRNAVIVLQQPLPHETKGDGGSQQRTDSDQQQEVARQHEPDPADGRAKDLADAYLFRPLFRDIGGQPKEAKAGDQDGEDGKDACQGADECFKIEFLVVFRIDKPIDIGKRGIVAVKYRRDRGDRVAVPDAGAQPVDNGVAAAAMREDERFDGREGRFHEGIADNP